ncbi:intraflagellar transport protein 46 homolog [Lucilia sericata]|uniref:intraflagellar transport protein 46 homolog n=1 Tax=Lucilia sericata TaxID=13632 RepID=UPI0018A87A9F|nr:intraflagellar transport protein 46 homolog [Lucilia sericata]
MNYYDEEITINGGDIKPPNSNIKVERISSRGSNSDKGNPTASGSSLSQQGGISMVNRSRQRTVIRGNSTDDDGLLQDIIDHDDEDDEDEDSDLQIGNAPAIQPLDKQQQQHKLARHNDLPRSHGLPGTSRIMNLPSAKALDMDTEPSETESEEGSHRFKGAAMGHATTSETQISITPDKWEHLALDPEIKELFPYILKYTPQHIETPYHLQPFIPEYVPAVGDVDAFLKVTEPPLLKPQRSKEMQEHLQKLGLYFLDEPSGTQSEPSLLNMKLRSALTGSSKNSRSTSAQMVPFAKSTKDIDKWINEVEQVHMSQSVYDAQPRKDIENMIIDWPRSYAEATGAVQEAYQQCLTEQHTLVDYVRILCQQFAIEGPLETQADYLLSAQTLFALYLAANQAWE